MGEEKTFLKKKPKQTVKYNSLVLLRSSLHSTVFSAWVELTHPYPLWVGTDLEAPHWCCQQKNERGWT